MTPDEMCRAIAEALGLCQKGYRRRATEVPYCAAEIYEVDEPPAFREDPAAALALVDAMHAEGWGVTFGRRPNDTWWVEVYWVDDNGEACRESEGNGETLPAAITLAAYHALVAAGRIKEESCESHRH